MTLNFQIWYIASQFCRSQAADNYIMLELHATHFSSVASSRTCVFLKKQAFNVNPTLLLFSFGA